MLYSKQSTIVKLALGILCIYLIAPLIAGLFHNGDRRGPKIFWIKHHQLLFTLSYEFAYDEKPRPPFTKRAWFYGLEGKPNPRIQAENAKRRFLNEVNGATLVAFRQSVWREGNIPYPVTIPRLAWPQIFNTNGVLQVRTEKYGVYIILSQGADHEGGIVILGNDNIKGAVEKGLIPYLSQCKYWENGIYQFYRELKN